MYAKALVRVIQVDLDWHKMFGADAASVITSVGECSDEDYTEQQRGRPLDTVFVSYDAMVVDEALPATVLGVQIVYYKENDEVDEKKILVRAKRGFWVWELFPLRQHGKLIRASFAQYAVTTGKVSGTMWALSGGVHVKFAYDCDKQVFVVKEIKTWGI